MNQRFVEVFEEIKQIRQDMRSLILSMNQRFPEVNQRFAEVYGEIRRIR